MHTKTDHNFGNYLLFLIYNRYSNCFELFIAFPKIERYVERSLGHDIVVFRLCTIKRCILVLCYSTVYSSLVAGD